MKTYIGNIWNLMLPEEGYQIVIPVNLGWKTSGENVMGRGLAKEARCLFPGCDKWLGQYQKQIYELFKSAKVKPNDPKFAGQWTAWHDTAPLLFVPSKSLNEDAPWLSWKNKADPVLIDAGLKNLPEFARVNNIKKIAVPLLGAGNGGLEPAEMKSLIETRLGGDDRFALVLPKEFGTEGWVS